MRDEFNEFNELDELDEMAYIVGVSPDQTALSESPIMANSATLKSAGQTGKRQARGRNKRVVRGSLYTRIETAVAKEMKAAGRQNPLKVARVMRLAADAIDDLDASTLDRAAKRPRLLDSAMKTMLETIALAPGDAKTPAREGGVIVLGEDEDVKPLSAAAARAPFTNAVEDVGEDDRDYQTLSTTEVADILNVSRPTVVQWISDSKVIGLKGAKRGWRIPKAQIKRGKLAPGLADVAGVFGDPELAWHFLVGEQLAVNETFRPLDRLFAGDVEFVVGLAKGYGSDFV